MALLNQIFKLKGGVYLQYNKELTEHKPIEICTVPKVLYIPMQQHIGIAAKPLVKAGDRVLMGQKIGESAGFISANIHSSVSGKVKDVGLYPHPGIGESLAVVIENDFADTFENQILQRTISQFSIEELKSIISEAGIVGMGGAGFPTHVKITPPKHNKIDTFIVNGTECEPFLTADHRLMLEEPKLIVSGVEVFMKVLGIDKAIIAIEDNKKDVVNSLIDATTKNQGIDVIVLKTKYSQGGEKQLIKSVLDREVPSGKLPMDVGVVVNNVATVAAVAEAVLYGTPLYKRRLTVSGSGVSAPKNLLVRIGTTLDDVISYIGGLNEQIDKVISGGPMMGLAQFSLKAPIIKTTTGMLLFNKGDNSYPQESACIRCANCMSVCPAFLMPMMLHAYSFKGKFDEAQKYNALDCIECGCCSYGCPAKIPLLQSIVVAKSRINSNR